MFSLKTLQKLIFRVTCVSGLVIVIFVLIDVMRDDRVAGQAIGSNRTYPSLKVQMGHAGLITAIAFSPDDKIFATAGEDSKIKIWHVATGLELRTIDVPSAVGARHLVFTPDGKRLIAGAHEKLAVWDAATGEVLWNLTAGKSFGPFPGEKLPIFAAISAVAMSADGRLLAYSAGGPVTIVNVSDGVKVKSIEGTASSLSFAADGRSLAAANGSIRVWDLETGGVSHTFQAIDPLTKRNRPLNTAVISPDGTKLIGRSGDMSITSPDGRYQTGISYGNVVVWDLRTKRELFRIEKREGRWEETALSGVTVTPGGKHLIVSDSGGYVRLFAVDDGKPVADFAPASELLAAPASGAEQSTVAFTRDGAVMASAGAVADGRDGKPLRYVVRLWDLAKQKELTPFHRVSANGVASVALDHTGTRFVTSGDRLVEWRLDRETLTRMLDDPRLYSARKLDGEKLRKTLGRERFDDLHLARKNARTASEYSPDGTTLAHTDGDGTAELWGLDTGELLHSDLPAVGVKPFAFTSDGKQIFIIGTWSLDLWDVRTGKSVITLAEYSKENIHLKPTWISLDRTGKALEGRGPDGILRIWDAGTGKLTRSIPEKESGPETPTLPPRAWYISVAEDRLSVSFKNSETGDVLATAVSFGDGEWVVATPDGRFDTNKNLDKVEGLHWILPDDPLTPISLDLLARQYFEPGLLGRVLKCSEEKNCDKEFKPLPPIGGINRARPRLSIRTSEGTR